MQIVHRCWSLVPFLLLATLPAGAEVTLSPAATNAEAAAAGRLQAGGEGARRWASAAPQVAQVFSNGVVVGVSPGQARVTVEGSTPAEQAECLITVHAAAAP